MKHGSTTRLGALLIGCATLLAASSCATVEVPSRPPAPTPIGELDPLLTQASKPPTALAASLAVESGTAVIIPSDEGLPYVVELGPGLYLDEIPADALDTWIRRVWASQRFLAGELPRREFGYLARERIADEQIAVLEAALGVPLVTVLGIAGGCLVLGAGVGIVVGLGI